MRRITIHDLGDTVRLSRALNETLNCLRRSHLRLTASHICRLANIDTADLCRMRRLYLHPRYHKLVNKFKIWRLLHYLLTAFPTLVLMETRRGKLSVRLYKEMDGLELMKSLEHLPPPSHPFHSRKRKDKKGPHA